MKWSSQKREGNEIWAVQSKMFLIQGRTERWDGENPSPKIFIVGKIVPSCPLVGKIRIKQKKIILIAHGRKQKERNLL